MTYTIYDPISEIYSKLDTTKGRVTRWKPRIDLVSFDDAYSIDTMWRSICGLSDDEIVAYITRHTRYQLINDISAPYEFW